MTDVPASSLLQRGVSRPPASGAIAPHDVHSASALMEACRARNAGLAGRAARLRCECSLPTCRETFPAVAELHRGTADRFIVVPAHLAVVVTPADIDAGRVVRAADRFFVVELDGNAGHYPPPARNRADHGRLHSVWSTTTSQPEKNR